MSVGVTDFGVSFQVQITNAESFHDLEGYGEYSGGSGGWVGYFGIDAVRGLDYWQDDSSEIYGLQIQVGFGAGLDMHVTRGYTKTLKVDSESEE